MLKAMENFEFKDGFRYWISAYYRFGRRGGHFFDGNNFSDEALYNIGREYKNANNANQETIRCLTVYSVKLPTAGGHDPHNDCFYNSLVSILGDNKKLPKIINTAKKLKDYLNLDRDAMISTDHIAVLDEKVFPENTSITVQSGYSPYTSKKLHATLNFNLSLLDEHYTPLANKGKSKKNLVTKLYALQEELLPSDIMAVYFDGAIVRGYNGNYHEYPREDFKNLLKKYTILTKDLDTKKVISNKKELKNVYDFYIAMGNNIKEETEDKINIFKFKALQYCIMDALRFFSKNATLPEPMDAVEQFWCSQSYGGGHTFGVTYHGDAICYDKNGFYSSILASKCKVSLVAGHLANVKNEDVKVGEDGFKFFDYGMYRAKVENKKGEYKYFRGRKQGYYTHYDLNTAVRAGLEVEIIQDSQPNAYQYDKSKLVDADRVFKEYVDFFYDLKVKGNPYAKIFLNTMYGLMAKRAKIYKTVPKGKVHKLEDYDHELEDIDHDIDSGVTNGVMTKQDKIFQTNYARISVFITGKGRETLCKAIRQVEEMYPNSVLRSHTDSLVVKAGTDINKLKGFVIGKQLGEWKIEKQGKCKILNAMDVLWNDNIV
jgi:hypothetical protein